MLEIDVSVCRHFYAILFERLGHNADIGDARLFDRVHDGGEGAEGHVLIGAYEDELIAGIPNPLPQLGRNLIDVDGIVAQEHALILVDGDDRTLFGDLLHSAGLRNIDLDARLQHRRRHHKDNEQHQHHIDQRSDVDIGEGGLRAPISW